MQFIYGILQSTYQISAYMANRLKDLSQKFISDPYTYMNFNSCLPKEEQQIIKQVQAWSHKYVGTHELDESYEKGQFPQFLIKPLQEIGLCKYFVSRHHGGEALSVLGQGMVLATVASFDASVALFILLQAPLCGKTLEKLASEQQVKEYMPDLLGLKKIWGWALTQEKIGSNASQIQTNVKRNKDGYLLNGNKKWIGNAQGDYLIVYAQSQERKKVEGFIVNMKLPGIKKMKIENKLGMRCVQNYSIKFENVQLNNDAFLPEAKSFRKGVGKMLETSRVNVIFITFGVCMGVYRNAIQYAAKREQFSAPITSFQLVQEKLVKIMANVQAMAMICQRVSEMATTGEITTGIIAMFKAWTTERARQVSRWGREIMGGNGITHDRFIMKAITDIEALYTLEGTYQMNTLIAGRQITGISAIKKYEAPN